MADNVFPDFAQIDSLLQERAPDWADRIADLVRERAPVGQATPEHEPGALRDSIKGEASGLDIRITSDVPYARYVLEGTGPHTIEPRQARALRFWAADGAVVFAKIVQHPGTQANDFPNQARDEILGLLRDEIPRALREALALS